MEQLERGNHIVDAEHGARDGGLLLTHGRAAQMVKRWPRMVLECGVMDGKINYKYNFPLLSATVSQNERNVSN